MEKDLNLLIGNYIEELADDGGEIKYYFTRDDDKDISFADRCELANDLNADLFVSLHNNDGYKKIPESSGNKRS